MFQCLLNVYCGAGLGSTLVHTALFNLDLGDRYYDPHSTRDDVETWSKSELSKVIQLERPGLSLAPFTAVLVSLLTTEIKSEVEEAR